MNYNQKQNELMFTAMTNYKLIIYKNKYDLISLRNKKIVYNSILSIVVLLKNI